MIQSSQAIKNENRQYPLLKKYRILITDDVSDDLIKQMGTLHPLLLRSGYHSSHIFNIKNIKKSLTV